VAFQPPEGCYAKYQSIILKLQLLADQREAEMSIPNLSRVRKALWEELENAGGSSQRQDVIEALAERFKLSKAEIEQRDPSGGKTFAHRVDSAVAQLRIAGRIKPVAASGRGIGELS